MKGMQEPKKLLLLQYGQKMKELKEKEEQLATYTEQWKRFIVVLSARMLDHDDYMMLYEQQEKLHSFILELREEREQIMRELQELEKLLITEC